MVKLTREWILANQRRVLPFRPLEGGGVKILVTTGEGGGGNRKDP